MTTLEDHKGRRMTVPGDAHTAVVAGDKAYIITTITPPWWQFWKPIHEEWIEWEPSQPN